MGLEPFEVRFFCGQKFTKFDLALKWPIRNFLKLVHDVFNDFTEKFFGCQKSYGKTSRLKKFYTNFFFQLRVRAHGGIQLKICFSTIKDLRIWFFANNGIFLSQNSYGYKTHLYSFRAIFWPKLTQFDLTLEIIIRNRSKVP